MRDHHRRYWGEKRQFHYREHRRRDRDGRRYDRRQRGYTNDATPGVIGSPERDGGRVQSRSGQRSDYGNVARRDGRGDSVDAPPILRKNVSRYPLFEHPSQGREILHGFNRVMPAKTCGTNERGD